MENIDFELENRLRNEALAADAVYDPLTGVGCCGDRVSVDSPEPGAGRVMVPRTMTGDPAWASSLGDVTEWRRLRCRHDFEYWAATCVTIKHKTEGCDTRLHLNRAQRRVLAVLESDRAAGRPIRMIVLKARQWGGSTLVQMYMAWIQSCHRRNWHSLICAHVKDTAATIRGMYSKMLADYPEELWEGDSRPQFVPFERAINVREISGRGCRVTLASSENPESVRGSDIAMAHLSETAYWKSSAQHQPASLIRSICGSVALIPYSLIVMESTANGVGNYFHTEWLRCRDGHGDKHAVFVPWYEIEIYTLPLDRPAAEMGASLSEYELSLWHRGCTLEQIAWYRAKSAEYADAAMMHAEFPSDDTEAFAATGSGVFRQDDIERMRRDCRMPLRQADITALGLVDKPGGALSIWEEPADGADYVAAVDIGGRTAKADWSVMTVMRRGYCGAPHRVVAQWRGHTDHDLLAGYARQLADYYNEALLIIESNTLESETDGGGDSNLFVLTRLADSYGRLYCRGEGASRRPGFHTNRSTKAMIIAMLIEAVRDGLYVERSHAACDELTVYEQRPNGSYAAKEGHHDDIVMTRAMALYALQSDDGITDAPALSTITLPEW